MNGSLPQLAVVLVNYLRTEDTLACISSLHKSSYTNYGIVVVDNSPNDDLQTAIQSQYPGVDVLSPGTNLGFAAGNNVGIERALRSSCDAVLLLNNDTEVEPGTLEALMDVLRKDPEAGIIGGKIFYHTSPTRLWFAGGNFNSHSGFGGHVGIGEEDCGQYDKQRECDFITGCCMLIRKSVLDRIGALDEKFFAYLEDVDYCFRARRAGYRVLYEPRVRVFHKVSSTSSWDSPIYLYFNCRNKLILIRKHATLLAVLPHVPRLLGYYVRQIIRMTLKYRDRDGLRAVWKGIVDGLADRTGEHGAGRMALLGPGRKRR